MQSLETLESIDRIILVSDTIEDHSKADSSSKTLEYAERSYFEKFLSTLQDIKPTYHYETPDLLIKNADKHKKDIVFSIWSGKDSRNRRALVPSICEAYDIDYVGPDAYSSIISQDKSTAHEYCRRFEIKSPDYLIIDSVEHIDLLDNLILPLVIKPNFEGGSIGIDNSSLVKDMSAAKRKTKSLIEHFNDQIMVQSFIEGLEVSFIIYGNRKEIKLVECVRLDLVTDEIDLRKTIYSLDIKKHGRFEERNTVITDDIDDNLLVRIRSLFQSFNKIEILRVDGRIDSDGNFYLVELSPDVWLGEKSSVFCAFMKNGFTYKEMLESMIENSLSSHQR